MKVLFNEEDIRARIRLLAKEIMNFYGEEEFVFLVILKGAYIFGADLAREIPNKKLNIEFTRASSYRGTQSTGTVNIEGDLKKFKGKRILIVEDIVDTGLTLKKIVERLEEVGAVDVKICTLLDKKERRQVDLQPDFVGFSIPNEFVIGYGLDFDEHYRNLPFIGVYGDEDA